MIKIIAINGCFNFPKKQVEENKINQVFFYSEGYLMTLPMK